MSLLDDVSIVVTPNGYKAGELYAVVPVPTEGAELVTNGDFASATSWNVNSNWNINTILGVAEADGTSDKDINQSIWLPIIGKRYKVTFTVISRTQGEVLFRLGGVDGTPRTTTGTFTEYITATNTDRIKIDSQSSFIGSVDNVSVKEYTSADMDVTRETAATRVDEDGLVNYAKILGDELVPDGNFTNQAAVDYWQIASSRATKSLEDGFMRLTYDVAVGSALYKNNLATAGNDYLVTFRAKGTASSNFSAIGENSSVGNNPINPVLTSDWQDYKFIVPLSGITFRFYLSSAQIGETLDITNISVKEITRDNVPRIDYTGGGCPHILAEPMRTNLIPYSEDLTNVFYQKTAIETVTESTTLSPDGTSYGYTITPTSSATNHYFNYQWLQLTVAIGNEVTYSIFVKPNGYNFIQIASSTGFAARYQNFELTGNGVIGTGDVNGKTIEKIGDWYRCSVTETSTGANPRFLLIPSPTALATRNASFTGNATDGVLGWGVQVEEGSYATSYIPNFGTAAGVTRNQDIFTRDGIGSLINSTEGVLFVEMAALVDGGNFELISLSDGSNSNRCSVFFNNGNLTAAYRISNSNVFIHIEASDLLNFNKVAISYKQSQFKMFVNGYNVFEQLSGNVLPSNTFNKLSFDSGAGANLFYGKVRQLQVYNTADIDLAALTSS
jgi:hypothetical protein